MTVTDIAKEIIEGQKARAAESSKKFRELIAAILRGEKIPATSVEKILTAAGRTVQDFEAAVEIGNRRAELRAMIAAAEGSGDELREIQNRIDIEKEKFSKVEEKFRGAMLSLSHERDRVADRAAQADAARRELHGIIDQTDREALDAIRARLNHLDRLKSNLERELRHRRSVANIDPKSIIEVEAKLAEVEKAIAAGLLEQDERLAAAVAK